MFDSAFDCSFSDCFVPCAITFVIVMILMGVLHIWIYFRLVKLAKARYGEHFTVTAAAAITAPKKESQFDAAFKDPYPGISQLENVQEEELWRLFEIEKKKQGKNAVFPIESKYFSNLSSKFLRTKGYTDKQINNYRVIGVKLSKGWTM